MNLLTAAKKYAEKNISVIPTDDVKRSIVPWKPYQEKIATDLKALFENPKAKGIAVICGAVSLNLEVIDIDTKYDITGSLYEDYLSLIKEHNAELHDKLMIVQTKSGGYHLYYRSEMIEGNQKLAQRESTPEEKKANPNDKIKVLIETRGESGYVIAPPTEGYKKLRGAEIPVITFEERDLLLELARSFNQVFAVQERPHAVSVDQQKYGVSPFDDFNKRGDAEMILLNHNWKFIYERNGRRYYRRPGKDEGISGDYYVDKKWFTVFTTSSQFEAGKAYSPVGVFAMLECSNDFKLAYQKLIDQNYGEKKKSYPGNIEAEVYKRRADGMEREAIKTYLVKRTDIKDEQEAEKIIDELDKQWGPPLLTFWDVDKKGAISINRCKLERFLSEEGGFYLYFYDKNSNIFRVIRETDGLVEEASTEQIKKFIKEYILRLNPVFDGVTQQQLLEVVYRGAETYFSKGFFEFIERKDLNFLKDTATEAYFPFRNGVVVVTKDKIRLKSYGELNKCIWKTQVIDFDIDIISDMDTSSSEFCEFVQKVAGENEERTANALSLIGYLLHKFKDTTKPFSVILGEETEDEKKGGGTGKGIFVKALKYVLNVETIDGKNFKADKNFAFQRVGLDTNVIAIEDVRKNVDFESFYSIITEGITVEKKNKDELYIPYKDSPKILFTTNYTISSTGNHAKRRQKVIEFSEFFHPGNTPQDYFKHRLFDDWDRDEWNRFYNLMVWTVQFYLSAGIVEVKNSDTMRRKHIRLSYSEEFMQWFDGYIENGCEAWKPFSEVYHQFLNQNEYDKKDYTQKRFKKAMEDATSTLGYFLETQRNWQNAGMREIKVIKTTR